VEAESDVSPASEAPPVPFDVPAGWYDDPRGAQQYRYWDGVGWTDHVVPVPAGRAPVVPKSPRRRSSRAWVVAVLVLAGFLIALVLIEDSGDQELSDTAAASNLVAAGWGP
jgi:hypothetical protein